MYPCDVVRRENDIDFLSFRLWIGVWVSLLLLAAVALDLSTLIRYITRFTEESFAVLISVIFVYESVVSIAEIWTSHPVRTGAAAAAGTAAAAAAVELQCYCGGPRDGAHRRDNRTTTTDAGQYEHYNVDGVGAATVTIRFNETRRNSSFYRLLAYSLCQCFLFVIWSTLNRRDKTLFRLCMLAPTWTAFSDYTGPDFSAQRFFIFYFFFILVVR